MGRGGASVGVERCVSVACEVAGDERRDEGPGLVRLRETHLRAATLAQDLVVLVAVAVTEDTLRCVPRQRLCRCDSPRCGRTDFAPCRVD